MSMYLGENVCDPLTIQPRPDHEGLMIIRCR